MFLITILLSAILLTSESKAKNKSDWIVRDRLGQVRDNVERRACSVNIT